MTTPNTFEHPLYINGSYVKTHLASDQKRFLNYIIDGGVFILIFLLFKLVMTSTHIPYIAFIADNYLIISLMRVSYYFIMEATLGRTVGKIITKTKVVDIKGGRPSVVHALVRSLARLIPLDALSFITKRPVGWHDKLSKTRVVEEPMV